MVSAGPNSGSGRRSLDAEINLVPFIDLLSMCICFLLITAVWIQVGVMQVKQGRGTEVEATTAPLDVELKFASPTSFELVVKKGNKVSKKALLSSTTAAAALADLDKTLDGLLVSAMNNAAIPQGKSAGHWVSAGMVTPKAGVPYGDLVIAMDVLRKHQIVNLGVVPVGDSQ